MKEFFSSNIDFGDAPQFNHQQLFIVEVEKNSLDYLRYFPVAVEVFGHHLEPQKLTEENGETFSVTNMSLTDSFTSQTSFTSPERRKKRLFGLLLTHVSVSLLISSSFSPVPRRSPGKTFPNTTFYLGLRFRNL